MVVGLLGVPVLAGEAADRGGDLAPVVLPTAVNTLLCVDGGEKVRENGLIKMCVSSVSLLYLLSVCVSTGIYVSIYITSYVSLYLCVRVETVRYDTVLSLYRTVWCSLDKTNS